MAITINSDSNSRVSVNDSQELDLVTNGQTRFRVESTGQIKAVYESYIGSDYIELPSFIERKGQEVYNLWMSYRANLRLAYHDPDYPLPERPQ